MNKAAELREQEWLKVGDAERLKKAKARGIVDKDGKLTRSAIMLGCWYGTEAAANPELIGKDVPADVLRMLVELPGDKMKYVKGRMAEDRYGLPALPKQHGRRKPHVSKRQQAIHSRAVGFFRSLLNKLKINTEATKSADGKPEAVAPKLGMRAASMAAKSVARDAHDKRRRKRNMQSLSRRINYGLTPGNTNTVKFTR